MTDARKERGTSCVDLSRADWRKSSYSGGNGSCVEVAELGAQMAVRDSKDRSGAVLVFGVEAWRTFVGALKIGAYKA